MTECSVEGCLLKYHSKGYCSRHKMQNTRGCILETTRSDPNRIIKKNTHAVIIIRDVNHNDIAEALIDIDDIFLVEKYRWHICKGYIQTHSSGRILFLHRLIKSPKKNMLIDHINRNPLDNRKNNLRETTQSVNIFNSSIKNKSGCVGVRFDKRIGKWTSRIKKNNKTIYLGSFSKFEDAVKFRRKAELKYYGENRR